MEQLFSGSGENWIWTTASKLILFRPRSIVIETSVLKRAMRRKISELCISGIQYAELLGRPIDPLFQLEKQIDIH